MFTSYLSKAAQLDICTIYLYEITNPLQNCRQWFKSTMVTLKSPTFPGALFRDLLAISKYYQSIFHNTLSFKKNVIFYDIFIYFLMYMTFHLTGKWVPLSVPKKESLFFQECPTPLNRTQSTPVQLTLIRFQQYRTPVFQHLLIPWDVSGRCFAVLHPVPASAERPTPFWNLREGQRWTERRWTGWRPLIQYKSTSAARKECFRNMVTIWITICSKTIKNHRFFSERAQNSKHTMITMFGATPRLNPGIKDQEQNGWKCIKYIYSFIAQI